MSDENVVKESANQDVLSKAVKDLEQAQEHLAHAHADEVKAEAEIEEAIEKIKKAEHGEEKVTVHVVHVNEVEKASFEQRVTRTIKEVWHKSYEELDIMHQPKDIFQTGGDHPTSLMEHLHLTLREAKDRKVIHNYHFGIACETGGA